MGKKSLFQPTSDADKKKKEQTDRDGSMDQPPDQSEPALDNEAAAASQPASDKSHDNGAAADNAPETAVTPPAEEAGASNAPAAAETSETDNTAEAPAEEPALIQPEAPATPAKTEAFEPAPEVAPRPVMGQVTPPPLPPIDNRRFDSSSGDDAIRRFIMVAGACLGFLILLVIISSALNAGRYYVRETKGAVEIWKGNFTPVGRDRVMILHGTHWEGAKKDAYTKTEAYDFAARFYAERALFILNDTGMQDIDRIYDYLEAGRRISAEYDNTEQVEMLKQVVTYLEQAAVLHASREKAAQQVKEKRINAAKHALAGMLVEDTKRDENDKDGSGAESSRNESDTHKKADKKAPAGH